MDFSIDVTELETFGSLDKDASTNTIVSDSESPEPKPSSLKNSLLDRLKMEKEIINSNPTKTRCSSDVVNDVKKKRLSSQEPSKTSDSDTQLRTTSNESDSDDDKLVIDVDSKMREHSNKAATPSIPTPPQPPRDRKSAKKISKDIDPLGQILKMQTQLLKTDPKKMEQASLVTLERSEPSTQHAPSFQQNLSSSFMESQRKVDVSHPSNVKYLLSHELMTLKEDSAEYEVEPEENCSYKLFSLDDLLLLVKSPVHMARTRSIKKTCKVQIPSFLLSKVNYQTCYGVEVLTDSERCRLWTESLIHSKCEMFVGHVDALTSKFFMLEEITVENVKESMSNFK
ncbi:hypothetical protein GDO81_020853 [Engystomops pustulosus]|uniref:Little elongation complex subunit 2 C-terminal domain-containing protein n=1 Tax=Engystomops pustulosus TaxID=76066 RepID=A0AAV6ZDL1_ENGPU|nr:hypothetical protein GDO81_020853 [Engystomops pustulosus]KAG8545448.1 hypothetical protein GDO81_020853 [Engystomops pustulosus]